MADTVKQTDELRIKCTLRQGATQTTRTLTVSNPKTYNATEQQRMVDFREKLMSGSLSGIVQPASWRDGTEEAGGFEPYETAEVEFSTFSSTEIFHDLEAEPEPLTLSWSPAEISSSQVSSYLRGNTTVTLTADNGESTANYSFSNVTCYGAEAGQTLSIGGGYNEPYTFKMLLEEGASPPQVEVFDPVQTANFIVITVTDAVTGRQGTTTLPGADFSPKVTVGHQF